MAHRLLSGRAAARIRLFRFRQMVSRPGSRLPGCLRAPRPKARMSNRSGNMDSGQHNSNIVSFFRVLLQDVGFGLRQLRKSPAFAGVVIGSLALGIGASVAVFSVVRAVLLDPYPYKDANRMVHVE